MATFRKRTVSYSGVLTTETLVIGAYESHQRGGYECSEACDSSDVRHMDDAPPRRAVDPDACDTCGGHWEPCYYRCIGPDAYPHGRGYLDDFSASIRERADVGLEFDADVETALRHQARAGRAMRGSRYV